MSAVDSEGRAFECDVTDSGSDGDTAYPGCNLTAPLRAEAFATILPGAEHGRDAEARQQSVLYACPRFISKDDQSLILSSRPWRSSHEPTSV